jgi:hypothetical protein
MPQREARGAVKGAPSLDIMETVIARTGFEHHGTVRRGQALTVSSGVAAQLARAGLVDRAPAQAAGDPRKAAGRPSSASPAAPASPQTTAAPSKRGGGKRKDTDSAASSSSTPASA